jgi:predicted peptidase
MIAPEFSQSAKFEVRLDKKIRLQYLLYLPGDYSTNNGKRWPLIMFLHGAGERGTNLKLVAKHGPPKLVAHGKQFPFVIVSPQCPSGQTWNDDALLALLKKIISSHRIDQSRVYLTGLSMGGYGAWSLAVNFPEYFAAAAPVCGGGNGIDVLLAEGARKRALRSLPIHAFHGANDTVVPVSESRRMLTALKLAGCRRVKLTVYPKTGHDSYTRTYNNQELYRWFLRHRRR